MKYKRRMMIQAAHFNGAAVYTAYRDALRAFDSLRDDPDNITPFNMLVNDVLPHIHGHNFYINVTIEAVGFSLREGEDFFVNDKAICQIIEAYNNTNLSVMPEFLNNSRRATTERLAETIMFSVRLELNEKMRYKVTVSVEETPDISASVTEIGFGFGGIPF